MTLSYKGHNRQPYLPIYPNILFRYLLIDQFLYKFSKIQLVSIQTDIDFTKILICLISKDVKFTYPSTMLF